MEKKLLASRLALSASIGIVVFIISVLAVWHAAPDTLMTNTMIDNWTRSALRTADQLLQERIEKGEPLPKSLKELSPELVGITFSNSRVSIIKHGIIVDGWGRPPQYSVQGTSYTLQSYGRDGKPGGKGFDRDLDRSNYSTSSLNYNSSEFANAPMPTLCQFLFELPTNGMIWSCAISGIIAFFTALVLIRPTQMSRKTATSLAVKIIITMGATVFFAMLIMQLHIPTGH